MRKLLILTAILLSLGSLSNFAPTASAGAPVDDAVIDDSANWTDIVKMLEGDDTSIIPLGDVYTASSGSTAGPYTVATGTEIATTLEEAGVAGGIGGLGLAGSLPLLAAGAPAFYVGWQIGGTVDHWLGISQYFGADPGTPGTGYMAASTTKWYYVKCDWTGGGVAGTAGVSSTQTLPLGITASCVNVVTTLGLSNPSTTYGWLAAITRTDGTVDTNYCNATTGGGDQNSLGRTELLRIATALGTSNVTVSDIPNSGGCAPGYRGALWATPAQMLKMRRVTSPILGSNPGGSPATVPAPDIANTNRAACTTSSSCATAIRTRLKAGGSTSSTTEVWIVHQLDPSVEPDDPAIPQPIEVLKPLPNETYDEYSGRLVTEGYLGTITRVDETSPVDGYGPGSPTRVAYTDGSPATAKVLDPLAWPTPAPMIKPDVDITIRVNTDDAIPAPTEPIGPDENSDNCSTCAIDWTPIEDLDVGTKFPFGVPTWFHDVLGGYTFDGDCRTLDIGKPAAIGGGTLHIPFCSTEWEDTYRPIVFPILEALMTIAAVTYMGARIFGIGSEDG